MTWVGKFLDWVRHVLAGKGGPELARAFFNKGHFLLERGDLPAALSAFDEALKLKPDSAAAHYNVGLINFRLGATDAAIVACRQAIAFKPDFANAHLALGIALMQGHALDDAIACFDKALAIEPDLVQAHRHRGIAFQDIGQLERAIACYQQVIGMDPDIAEVHCNLGSALQALGRWADAVASYERTLEINPLLVEAHFNLGITLQSIPNMDRAESAYRRAIEVQSDYAPAHNNLGKLFLDLGRCEAAFDCFHRALEIQPNFVAAHLNLGIALATMGEHHAAKASYQRVLELDPTNASAHLGMGEALKYYGDFDASIASILLALETKPDYALAHSNLLFQRNYLHGSSEALSFVHAQSFGEMVSRIACAYTHWPNPAVVHRCLRVGFMSGDLSNHPVGYFVECVVAALSAQNPVPFELVAYSTHDKNDEVSQRIRAHFDAWHSVERLSDEDLARHIWTDGIDVLVDLSGHTAHNRLPVFGWRPAPVQVSWLGYFATTGVAEMDYFIADHWTLAPEQEVFFTEKIWRLPETRLCFTAPNVDVEVNPLPAGANGFVTFGCFNNLSKMNDAVVGVWAQILNQLPGSKLFLKCPQLSESVVQAKTCERFAAHGIDAGRLILEHYDTRAKYLATYHRIDIALDPFPYPGGTTTVEALWMGIPVLTLAGDKFLSRQGVGLLMNADLPDWVATDADDYIARAVGHATDLPKLTALRARLREQVLASPVFDAQRFAKHFEEALRGMWHIWCANTSEVDLLKLHGSAKA